MNIAKNPQAHADRKAILVVSFGTSYAETRAKTIDAAESALAQAYPDYTVRRAFTSSWISAMRRAAATSSLPRALGVIRPVSSRRKTG